MGGLFGNNWVFKTQDLGIWYSPLMRKIIWFLCTLGLGQNESKKFWKDGYRVQVVTKWRERYRYNQNFRDTYFLFFFFFGNNSLMWLLTWRLGEGILGKKKRVSTECTKTILFSTLMKKIIFPNLGFSKPNYFQISLPKHKFLFFKYLNFN